MKTHSTSSIFSTVSRHFVEDWIEALRELCSEDELCSLLERSDIPAGPVQRNARITLDQVVCLYQLAAVETSDEMMGLWERPIRPRALQHLLTSVREATSLPSVLYRFTTFWNLLLDDFQFELSQTDQDLKLNLSPQRDAPVQRFGHMLILKLAHGLMSWMAGKEVPVKTVGFAFDRPLFEQDYSVIFPAQVAFGETATSLSFDKNTLDPVQVRTNADLVQFLQNAPRDWIFTQSREHTQSIRVRSCLSQNGWDSAQLKPVAQAMHMTPRTLIRRLNTEGTSFQEIKDGLRRDMAIRDLQAGNKSIEAIAHTVGFSSAANFHRAFLRWTGGTPSSYRRN